MNGMEPISRKEEQPKLHEVVVEHSNYSEDDSYNVIDNIVSKIQAHKNSDTKELCTDIRDIQNRNFSHIERIEEFLRVDNIRI